MNIFSLILNIAMEEVNIVSLNSLLTAPALPLQSYLPLKFSSCHVVFELPAMFMIFFY
jgi:hypothetical protein